MTKEIREGLAKGIYKRFERGVEWDKSHKNTREYFLQLAGVLLAYLDSKGVVRRVDRELPREEDYDYHEDEAFDDGQRSMVEAGYIAVESLMYCSICKKVPCTCPSINRGSFAKYVEEGVDE